MFTLAIATSIDALAVGITFAFLKTPIVEAITIIGIVTLVISVAGVVIGNFFGSKFKSKAELAGGVILVCLGLKILLEHLGIFG
jgi:putative Mn2+ efflux pump MntP